jgi:lipopolysaccharide transport system ATP-binding protein
VRPSVTFDHVWKKFRRGERHDSLRDLIPNLLKAPFKRRDHRELNDHEFWVLRDVSFEVPQGDALAIIGPNGAGKSTALKLLTRILRPTRGQCEVRGRVGALIEVAAGFHPDLTGRENVLLQGAIMGMHRQEIERHFDEIVDFSGIGAFIDTPLKRYSSGMQARLGFSVAAHLDPDVLFVDEVLSVGDMSFQAKCLEKMQEKITNGTTVIFVSHNLQAVASLCRRCIVLGNGGKLFDGEPTRAIDVYLDACRVGSKRYGASTSSRFTVRDIRFRRASGDIADAGILPPHEPCRIEVDIECTADAPPFSVGVEFERTNDLLYCYGIDSQSLDIPRTPARAGEVFTVSIDFVAHFARGHYRLNLNVRDSDAAIYLMYAESVVNFTIDEPRAHGGVVDVEPRVAITAHRAVEEPVSAER